MFKIASKGSKSHKIGYFLPNLRIELKPSLAPRCLSFCDPALFLSLSIPTTVVADVVVVTLCVVLITNIVGI